MDIERELVVDLVRALQRIATALDGMVESPTTPLKTYGERDYSDLPWTPTKKEGGFWIWSDKSEGLAQKVHEAGGKMTVGEHVYSLYGDINPELGIRKCVSRWPAED